MAHKAAISFLLNSLEQQPQQPQQSSSEVVVLGDFTCEPGSSNAICIEQPQQPQQTQQTQQTQLRPRSAFVPYVRPSASSMTNLANPKKRKAPPTNLPLHNTANKQRRLETTPTTTATTTMSLLREDVVAQISSIKERTVMQFTTPDTDVNTCRRNKLLALQLLKESSFASFCPQQQQDSFVDRERATPQQVAFLDRIFVLDPFPSAATRSLIAEKLGMTPKRIQNWFQNKRARSSHNNDNNNTHNSHNTHNTHNNDNNNDYNSDNDNPASEKKRKGGKRKGGDSGDAFVFHHLALCPNGQLVLSSDGAPPLLLKPSLLRADRF